tara:strand:- start:3365 stop:4873 length:1509 start_codon:yes stop_codon:yes gene_type:complete
MKALTYDDVLIKPKYSDVMSRRHVCLESVITKNITLKLPIISSNMDTITEDEMAIAIAKVGGLGIIHRYCTIDAQVEMVKRVKRYTNHFIDHPYTVSAECDMGTAIALMAAKSVGSLLIIPKVGISPPNIDTPIKPIGVLTTRDMARYTVMRRKRGDEKVKDFMTTELITYTVMHDLDKEDERQILALCLDNRIEQVPILNAAGYLIGLVTLKDLMYRNPTQIDKDQIINSPFNVDANEQLVVGAAVGVRGDYMERANALIDAGVNILCVDVAHGHHKLCGDAVRTLKARFPSMDIIAGNVCSAEGVNYLADAGADCVKVGIGPGSICITRRQTGCGVPQLTAVAECAEAARIKNITVIADGGHNGTIGNIFKALCVGSSASMLGGMLSGTLETPGAVYTKLNKKVKVIRGMAGVISNYSKAKKLGTDTALLENMTPEGVEGYVPFKGPVKDILQQIEGGIRSGMSYIGCHSLMDIDPNEIEFVQITSSGFNESGSHGIKEL